MSKTKIYRLITKMTLLYLLFLGQNCGEELLSSSLKDLFPGCIKGCWSVVILFVLINSFVAVLVDVYSEIREEQGADFSDVQVGTFLFNFFLNKIKAFHSKIACGKAQLSHKFLSKAPTMGNSHSSSGHICFESQQCDFLDSSNYKRFEPPDNQSVEFKADCPGEYLNSIKLFETIKKENAHGNEPAHGRADIKSNHDFKRTSDEVHFSSLKTSYSTRPRCPRECLYTNIKNDAFNESFDEDKLIFYITTLFMEIRNDLRRTYA